MELVIVRHPPSGGSPSKRRTAEVGAVEWNVDYGGTPGSELYYLRVRYYDRRRGGSCGRTHSEASYPAYGES
ncbi:MAG: hypothetical protein V3S98_10620 [Dehalococcoidia bacterium]